MAKQVDTQIHEETKLWSFITLCQSKTRMQGRKSQKKSTIQQFRKLWNPTCEIGRGKESLQDRELISCRTISQLVKPQFQLAKFSQVVFELAKSTYNLRYLRTDSV